MKTNLNIIPGCSTGWAKSVSPEERRRLSVSDQLLPPNTRSLFLIIIARHFSPHMSKLTNPTLIRILPFILLLVVIPLFVAFYTSCHATHAAFLHISRSQSLPFIKQHAAKKRVGLGRGVFKTRCNRCGPVFLTHMIVGAEFPVGASCFNIC